MAKLVAVCGLLLIARPAAGAETVHLTPDSSASWSLRNLAAPVSSLFLGPGFYYGERKLQVETTPPNASVDLFYVRAGFQKRYEQAEAPVTVLLPKRIDANPKDVVIVRAFLDGFRYREQTVKVTSRTRSVLIELEPLPNVLRAVSHKAFGGRETLAFLTQEPLTLRLTERKRGFQVALNETAQGEGVAETLAQLRSPLIAGLEAHQLGDDLLVQVRFAGGEAAAPEVRSRARHDPIRELHITMLDLVTPDAGAEAVARTRAALAAITPADVTGCAAVFDETLREALDPERLSRALAPRGEFTDPYLRAAMRRLGEISPGGLVTLRDGTQLDVRSAMQLSAASNEGAQARGFLALLRRLVAHMQAEPDRAAVLRSLIAPEADPGRFAEHLAAAERAEAECRAR